MSSTSSTAPRGTSPSTLKASCTLRYCCWLFCIVFCGSVRRVLSTTFSKGIPSACASLDAKLGTSSVCSSDGTDVTHSGSGDGRQRFEISSHAASTSRSWW